jgi:hypothetical protein
MKKFACAATASAFALFGCTHRELTDAQLVTLLHAANTEATDPNARLDTGALTCLRAWSGDAELVKGLAPGLVSDDGKRSCRGKLDNWIADATRNPDKLAFDDFVAPAAVRRAMALQTARSAASDSHEPPAAMMKKLERPPAILGPTTSTVDLGDTGVILAQAEDTCREVQKTIAAGNKDARLKRFGDYCAATLIRMRSSMEGFAKRGDSTQMKTLEVSARGMNDTGRKLLMEASSKP